jgi:hypothetical protein
MYPWAKYLSAAVRGETYIGLGLVILIAFAWWPGAPLVTAIAIIAMGATDTMASRFRASTAAVPIMVLHGTTYALLYALFVGARLHTHAAAPSTTVSGFVVFDLIASAFPMAIALKRISGSLWQSTPSRR